MKISSEAERVLCYAAGILQAKISNPGNIYSVEGLIPGCIKEAKLLIERVYKEVDQNHESSN